MVDYLVVATHDFTARTESELSFKKGDILTISEKDRPDSGWLFARLDNNEEGNLPQTYVSTQVTRAIALFNYKAQQDHELSFRKGDLLTVIRKYSKSDWWEGAKANRTNGMFPTNYVKVIFDKASPSPEDFKLHEQQMQAKISQKKQQRQLENEKRREKNPQSASDKFSSLQPEHTLDGRRGPPVSSSSSTVKHDAPVSQRGVYSSRSSSDSHDHSNGALSMSGSSTPTGNKPIAGLAGIIGSSPLSSPRGSGNAGGGFSSGIRVGPRVGMSGGPGGSGSSDIVAEQKRKILELKSQVAAQDADIAHLKLKLDDSETEARRLGDEVRRLGQLSDSKSARYERQIQDLEAKLSNLQRMYDDASSKDLKIGGEITITDANGKTYVLTGQLQKRWFMTKTILPCEGGCWL